MDIKPTGSFNQSTGAYTVAGLTNAAPQTAKQIAPPAPVSPVQPATPVADVGASEEQLAKALDGINKAMQNLSSGLEFSVDNESRRTIVKIVDRQTQEVIRQMPTKEALEIAKALDRLQGLLIQQKA